MKVINGDNLYSLEGVRHDPCKCSHKRTTVYEERALVECRDCGAQLDPIWVLTCLAREETRFERKRDDYIKEKEALDKRVRTKCQHCGKITRIRGH